ncbi:MAG: hypothetical protein HY699_08905 [Deltaproteobacteria bacterium]|nr:hypothetical protein [Deltaproteobacteria bacterium]
MVPQQQTRPAQCGRRMRLTRRWVARLFRRIGYFFRHISLLLALTAENQAISSILLLIPTLLATALLTIVLSSHDLSPRIKALWAAALVALPAGLSLYFYLLNISRQRRAELSIRARRHSDTRTINYFCRSVIKLCESVAGSDPRIQSIGTQRVLAVETEFVRSRAVYIRHVLDQVASHFGVTRELLEQALGIPAMVLETRAARRVWLRYHMEASIDPLPVFSAQADAIDRCATRVRTQAEVLSSLADDFSKILRFVVKEPSTGRAMNAAARILARHIGGPNCESIISILQLRRGVPIDNIILGNRDHRTFVGEKSDSLIHFLKHFGSFEKPGVDRVVNTAAERLSARLAESALILTVGYSQMVSRVLAQLAHRKSILVGVVIPERGSELDQVIFAEEDRAMEAELLAEPLLQGKVFRTTLAGIGELPADFVRGGIMMGAEAVLPDGTVLHPRGRLQTHRALALRFSGVAQAAYRFVVCEPYKIIDVPAALRTSRTLACITTGDYDTLITAGEELQGGARVSLQRLRVAWEREVDQDLQTSGMQGIFHS